MTSPKEPLLPDDLASWVTEVGSPVSSSDVDTFGKLQDIRDRSHWVRTVVTAWKHQQAQDRAMREKYALWLMVAMALQVVTINVVFVLIGCKVLDVEPWTARTFIMAVFSELAAMVWFVLKYLFRSTGDKVLELVQPFHRPQRK